MGVFRNALDYCISTDIERWSDLVYIYIFFNIQYKSFPLGGLPHCKIAKYNKEENNLPLFPKKLLLPHKNSQALLSQLLAVNYRFLTYYPLLL